MNKNSVWKCMWCYLVIEQSLDVPCKNPDRDGHEFKSSLWVDQQPHLEKEGPHND